MIMVLIKKYLEITKIGKKWNIKYDTEKKYD